MTNKVDLVEWIRNNPKAVFTVDNDYWWAYSSPEVQSGVENGLVEEEELFEQGHYISSSNAGMPYVGYGSGNSYGGDILQALAKIVGVTVEGC